MPASRPRTEPRRAAGRLQSAAPAGTFRTRTIQTAQARASTAPTPHQSQADAGSSSRSRNGGIEQRSGALTKQAIDEMSAEQLKAELEKRGHSFPPNARVQGLREKLYLHSVETFTCALCGTSEVSSQFEEAGSFHCLKCRERGTESGSRAEKRKRVESAVNVETALRELLKCTQCKQTMCPPIWQCRNGHTISSCCGKEICSECGASATTKIRNLPLEHLAEKSSGFPCPFAKWGCKEVLGFSALGNHQLACKHKPLSCPEEPTRSGSARFLRICKWQGRESEIVEHLKKDHARTIHVLKPARAALKSAAKKAPCLRFDANLRLSPCHLEYCTTEDGEHNFKLETRNPHAMRGGASEVFACVSYLGESKKNTWFVEITVGSSPDTAKNGGLSSARSVTWSGRVHDLKFSVEDLEARGEGLFLCLREMRALSLTAGHSGVLPLSLLFREDPASAALTAFQEPSPRPAAPPPSSGSSERFSVLSRYHTHYQPSMPRLQLIEEQVSQSFAERFAERLEERQRMVEQQQRIGELLAGPELPSSDSSDAEDFVDEGSGSDEDASSNEEEEHVFEDDGYADWMLQESYDPDEDDESYNPDEESYDPIALDALETYDSNEGD